MTQSLDMPAAAQGVGMSALTLIPDGIGAFARRAASARAATESLDLQYYMWKSDLTGQLLMREALAAADRGVPVRILVDAMYGLGRTFHLAALAGHPAIAVRRFNATRWRRWGQLGLALEVLLGNWRLNRRMHNKAWIADGQLVICGGRNIGDSYFDASGEMNFRDLDVELSGAPVADAAALFEAFWQDSLSRPVRPRRRFRALRRLRARLERLAMTAQAQTYLGHVRDRGGHCLAVPDREIRIIGDPPGKAHGLGDGCVAPTLRAMLAGTKREALLISPYFIPGEALLSRLIAMVQAGIRVSVITNSLAATDVMAAHAGYSHYRRRLILAGVELHELKHSSDRRASMFGSSSASLHTKAVVVDDRLVFIGSFNLDPRSANLNTEMGVLVNHAVLARLLRRQHAWLASGERSWRLAHHGGSLAWQDGRVSHTGSEPGATLTRRILTPILSLLPIESQL